MSEFWNAAFFRGNNCVLLDDVKNNIFPRLDNKDQRHDVTECTLTISYTY